MYIFKDRGVFINVYKADDNIVTSGATSLADINLWRTYRAIDSVATGRIPSLFCDISKNNAKNPLITLNQDCLGIFIFSLYMHVSEKNTFSFSRCYYICVVKWVLTISCYILQPIGAGLKSTGTHRSDTPCSEISTESDSTANGERASRPQMTIYF